MVRLAARASRRDTADRRTVYLAHAYACHDMALRAGNAEDEKVLRAMTLVWRILASRHGDAAARWENSNEIA